MLTVKQHLKITFSSMDENQKYEKSCCISTTHVPVAAGRSNRYLSISGKKQDLRHTHTHTPTASSPYAVLHLHLGKAFGFGLFFLFLFLLLCCIHINNKYSSNYQLLQLLSKWHPSMILYPLESSLATTSSLFWSMPVPTLMLSQPSTAPGTSD